MGLNATRKKICSRPLKGKRVIRIKTTTLMFDPLGPWRWYFEAIIVFVVFLHTLSTNLYRLKKGKVRKGVYFEGFCSISRDSVFFLGF